MARQIVEMRVELATMELPDTKMLKLQWPGGYDADFKTGQFIKDKPAGFMRAHSNELLGTHLSSKSSEYRDDFCPMHEEEGVSKPVASSCDDTETGKSGCGCS